MSNPLVSIIVPVYNAEKTAAYCLESICGQTYPALEILVLNDGSADGSLAVCRQLAAQDPRIRVIDKPNTGVSDTRNRGLDLARGKYVQFVDSDDCLLPEYTETLVAAAEQAAADLVISAYWLVFPADFEEHPRWWEKAIQPFVKRNPPQTALFGFLPDGVYTGQEYACELIRRPYTLYHAALWNKLYRREALVSRRLHFERMRSSEDFRFNTALLPALHTVAAVSYAGYGYVQNAGSLCHTSISNWDLVQSRFSIYRDYRSAYQEMDLYAGQRRRILASFFAENEFTLPSVLPQQPVPELFRRLFG